MMKDKMRATVLWSVCVCLCLSVVPIFAAAEDTFPRATPEELAALRAWERQALRGEYGMPIDSAMQSIVNSSSSRPGSDWWRGLNAPVEHPPARGFNRDGLDGLDAVGRGREIFRRSGCHVCHGAEGRGGVVNFNYVKDTYPQLSTIARRMFIKDIETQKMALKVLNAGKGLDQADELEDDEIDIPKIVSTQYAAVVKIVENGNPAQIKNPAGPPPASMPTWRPILSENDICDILAYLIGLQIYEEEDE